ncbi:hypothetical protein D3C74_399010 [compost metagenome]
MPRFPSDPEFGPGQKSDQAIACTIEEDRTLKADSPLRAHHPAGNRLDLPRVFFASGLYFMHIGIEVECNIGFGEDGFQNNQIP